jgi:Domain of unknown function (DUF6265)
MKSLLLLVLLAATPLQPAKIEDLAWMEGHWAATIDGVATEEIWSAPGGGMMLGMHRDIRKTKTSFEFFRVAETPEGLVYFAQPSGRPPTPFHLTEARKNWVVFENPEHDFPKRIIYSREGNALCASVDGGGQSKGEEKWCWEKR